MVTIGETHVEGWGLSQEKKVHKLLRQGQGFMFSAGLKQRNWIRRYQYRYNLRSAIDTKLLISLYFF